MDGATELDVADDIEASGYFSLNVLNNGVTARIPNSYTLQDDAGQLPPRCNLFAISNVFGWALVATQDGFSLINMADLRSLYLSAKQRTTPDVTPATNVEIGPEGLTFLKFAMGDKYVIAAGPALQGGIGIWRLKSLVDGSNTSPEHVFPPVSGAALLDLLPNPSDRPELVAVLSQDGQASMLNLNTKTVVTQFGSNITAACWSVKGKQIVCGDNNGTLTQYTPEGDAKTVTEAAPSLRGRNLSAIDIRWVENTVFFVTYIDPSNPMDTQIFINIRQKSGSVDYAQILDPLMVEYPDRPEARYNIWLKNWTPFKHLLLVSNTTSNTISHIGQAPVEEGSDNIVWSQVKNDLYTTLPLETFPLGLEVDLTATEAPSAEENAGEVPTPVVWSYATDGTLSAWRVVNKTGGAYAGIAAPSDVMTNEEAGASSTTAPAPSMSGMQTPTSNPTPASASPFSTPLAKPSFGAPAFGGSSFSSPPTFGSPAFGAPAFGRTPSFAPAFGQSAFGSSTPSASPAPAFGQPAFGKPAFGAAAAPAGGSLSANTGGFASFSSNKPATGFVTPANSVGTMSPAASTSSSPTEAASSTPAKPPAFSFTSFGNTSFASLASKAEDTTSDSSRAPSPSPAPAVDTPKPSPFTTSFGSAPSTSTTSKPAFGSSTAFGATSAFGASSSSSSPFSASTSKPATPTGSGGFGAFSSDNSKGFRAFSGSSGTGFSFGTPQQTPKADASPAFSAVRDSSTSAFGGLGAQASAKPAGLSDTDADALEPEHVADQKGGALDFSAAKPADSLSMTGFGFGSSAKAEESSSPKSFSFGSFGKVATTVKQIEERNVADQSASPPRAPAKRLSFGSPSSKLPAIAFESQPSTVCESSSESVKPVDSKPAEEKKPAFSFATPSAKSEKPSAFGSTAFGQTSAFGSSPSSGFSFTKPTEKADASKSAFSAFASTSSTSASPFGSPAPSSPFTPFGKPGFFSSFGQKSQADESKEKVPEESSTRTTSPAGQQSETAKATPDASAPEKKDDVPAAEEEQAENEDADEEEEEEAEQDEVEPEEEEEHYEEEGEGSEALSEFEHVEGEGEIDEVGSEEGSASQQETYEEEEETGVDEGDGEDQSEGGEDSESPVSPTPDKPVLQPAKKAEEDAVPAKSAFGFPVQGSATTPAFSGFSFGDSAAKKTEDKPSSSTSTASLTFPGFSKPAEAPQQTNKEPPKPVLNFAAPQPKRPESGKPFGFANLQKAAPRTSSPLASLPSFEPPSSPAKGDASASFASQSFATVDESTDVPKPADLFSLKPPSASAPASEARSPTSERPSLSQRTSQSEVSQAPPVAPPKLSSTPSAASKSALPSKGTINVFNSMQEELETLKESVAQCLEFFHSVQPARLPISKTSSAEELLDFEADSWSLGDLPRMKSMISHLRERLAASTAQAIAEEREAKSLEGSLLKTKTKTEEITRYLKAREDPAFARLVKIRQLGPEQLENQKRLRRVQQNVIEGLDQLEQAIATLKDKMLDRKLGRSPMKAPSLDSIHRASRNIIHALHAKNLELDDLALRLQMATLSTDTSGTPRASPARSSPAKSLDPIDRQNSSRNSSAMDAKVARMLAADEARKRLRAAWGETR